MTQIMWTKLLKRLSRDQVMCLKLCGPSCQKDFQETKSCGLSCQKDYSNALSNNAGTLYLTGVWYFFKGAKSSISLYYMWLLNKKIAEKIVLIITAWPNIKKCEKISVLNDCSKH